MMYNKDDVIYILENNTTIRKGQIARKQGENYIIQLIGSCGALIQTVRGIGYKIGGDEA